MSQHDYVVANGAGATVRSDINDALQALASTNKGSTAPATTYTGMLWVNDASTPWLLKFFDGTDWITIGEINATNNTFQPYMGTAAPRLLNYATDTGSANAYAVAPNPAITAYATGQIVTLNPANANTGASTINVNALGTKNIKLSDGNDPYANAMTTTGKYFLMYDGTNFILMNPEAGARINAQTGTTYTLAASDCGKIVTCSNASAITVTVPNTLKPGFFCTVTQKGAGQVTFSAQASGTLRNRSGFTKTAGQYASATIFIESNAGTAPEIYLGGDCA